MLFAIRYLFFEACYDIYCQICISVGGPTEDNGGLFLPQAAVPAVLGHPVQCEHSQDTQQHVRRLCPALYPQRCPRQPCSFEKRALLFGSLQVSSSLICEVQDLCIPLKSTHLLKVTLSASFNQTWQYIALIPPKILFPCMKQTDMQRYMVTPAVL